MMLLDEHAIVTTVSRAWSRDPLEEASQHSRDAKDYFMSKRDFNLAMPSGWPTRRQALKHAGTGFGYLALAGLMGRDVEALAASGASPSREHPLAPKLPHFPAKAKRISSCPGSPILT